jgi:hypothetical protein
MGIQHLMFVGTYSLKKRDFSKYLPEFVEDTMICSINDVSPCINNFNVITFRIS